MFIFHKTEVQTVIFRCLMGLNLDWFKIYGLWYKRRPRTCLANFQKIVIDKWWFYYHIWPLFASCVLISHKTEIQTVILRYLTSPNHNWYQKYSRLLYFWLVQYLWHKTQKCKKGKCVFLYKIAKHQKWKYLHFVSTTLEPIKF